MPILKSLYLGNRYFNFSSLSSVVTFQTLHPLFTDWYSPLFLVLPSELRLL